MSFSWSSSCSVAAQPASVSNSLNSAEQPATSLWSNVQEDEATAHKKMLRFASSAAQPASDSNAAQLAFARAMDLDFFGTPVITPAHRYFGTHPGQGLSGHDKLALGERFPWMSKLDVAWLRMALKLYNGFEPKPRELRVAAFVIHDDADNQTDGEVEDWVPDLVTHAPAASEGMVWHRYQNPENKETWFSCTPDPDLWCYANEVGYENGKDGIGWFRFKGEWQQVVNPPLSEPTAAMPTAATQPNPETYNGT